MNRSNLICLAAIATFFFAEDRADASSPVPGDYNGDGSVTHADYSVLGDSYGKNSLFNRNPELSGSVVGKADFDYYVANYDGEATPSPGRLEFELTPWQTPTGDIAWTFAVIPPDGPPPLVNLTAIAGHFGIQAVSYSGAPNIYAIVPGAYMTDDGIGSPGVPGSNPFGFDFLTPTDLYGNPNGKYSNAFDGLTSYAYVAFGSTLGHTFTSAEPVPLFTILTGSVHTTKLRILSGDGMSEFGYGGQDYYITEDIEATFAWPGDFNGDLTVDAADYSVWRDNLGTNFDLGGNGDEEGDSAGVVDLADYAVWKSRFGAILYPCGFACVGSGGVTVGVPMPAGRQIQVPEPSGAGLAVLALLIFGNLCRTRRV